MNRRLFFKALVLTIASFSFKIFPSIKKEPISFDYGVASGDPTNTHVILWTKLTTPNSSNQEVNWEVSSDKDFLNILVNGSYISEKENNFIVKVDAQIPIELNAKKIFYRFESGGVYSEIGTTFTLPVKNPNKFNIAFCSCSNYPSGYFNAYKEMARDADVDLVLHLGDYIYEYSREGYASSDAKRMGREVNPSNEIISLDDYRKRYATYRSDKDLQLLHKSKPMIVVWDDHEITNDTWKLGAQNHSPDEGSFYDRKNNAIRAYYEWMPIREVKEREKIWRSFTVGNLINLMMLDTRLYGREKQLEIGKYFNDNKLNKEEFKKDLLKPRTLLGKEQLKWVKDKVDMKYKWSIFGQQLLIGPKYLPKIFKNEEISNDSSYYTSELAGEELPFNTDQWDGYPREREEFYKTISNSQSNLILAGDSHNSWFSNLYDKNNEFVGIEIGAPAISSPSFGDTFKDKTRIIEDEFIKDNKDLLWVNGRNQGYVSLNITELDVEVQFKYVSTVKSLDYEGLEPDVFRVEHNKPYS